MPWSHSKPHVGCGWCLSSRTSNSRSNLGYRSINSDLNRDLSLEKAPWFPHLWKVRMRTEFSGRKLILRHRYRSWSRHLNELQNPSKSRGLWLCNLTVSRFAFKIRRGHVLVATLVLWMECACSLSNWGKVWIDKFDKTKRSSMSFCKASAVNFYDFI